MRYPFFFILNLLIINIETVFQKSNMGPFKQDVSDALIEQYVRYWLLSHI